MGQQETLHGQALAMQWVGFALQRLITDMDDGGKVTLQLLGQAKDVTGNNGLQPLHIGCYNVVNFVLPFALEVGLKSLLIKDGKAIEFTHDLAKLYNSLSETLKNKLEDEFPNQRKIGGSTETSLLLNLLVDHKDDFVGWRYLGNPENLKREENEMQFALSTILVVYDIF